MKNSTTTNKYPLPKDKIWTRLPERVKSLEDNLPNYKSFVALVTQVGTYPSITSGTPLVIGSTYILTYLAPGDDFLNVGYVADEVPFIATETTPTTWENGSSVKEIISSAFPTFEVIENTLGITLTSSCRNSNSFFFNSDLSVFLQNKTFLSPTALISNNTLGIQGTGMARVNDSQLTCPLFSMGATQPFTIKIEVYN